MFESFVGLVVKTAILPLSAAMDLITLGGILSNKTDGTYVGNNIDGISQSIRDITKS